MIKSDNIELCDGLIICVSYDYTPMISGRWYMPNGDPGYPDEPSNVEIKEVSIVEGNITDLIYYLDGYDAEEFNEWLEAKLYELND